MNKDRFVEKYETCLLTKLDKAEQLLIWLENQKLIPDILAYEISALESASTTQGLSLESQAL